MDFTKRWTFVTGLVLLGFLAFLMLAAVMLGFGVGNIIQVMPQCQHTIGMESGGALMIGFKDGVYVIEGSASIDPDYYDEFVTHAEGYYRWERFSFWKNGKLLGRSPKKK